MARILFISDNLLNEGLGIMYLSSYLKSSGHEVDLILLQDYQDSDEVLVAVNKYDPDLVGFSVMTPQESVFLSITKKIKEQTKKVVIWGGAHCMFMSERIMSHDCIDVICIGDGEEALLELMNRIDVSSDYTDIPSLYVKEGTSWVKNPLGHLPNDLDKYPFPDRSLYYDKYPLLANFPLKRLITSRGCPYKCSYCFEPTYVEMYKGKGKVVRRHSVEYVISEIKQLTQKYPTNHLHFSDDIFNLNKRWVHEFTDRYRIEIGERLKWTCNVELTTFDEKIVRSMAESGCRGVVFGLETGVEETRIKVLNKKITNKRYEEITKLFHQHDIKFIMNIMFCLPGESLSHAIESVRFASSLNGYGIRPCMLKVYKGTELHKYVLFHGLTDAVGNVTLKTKDTHNDFPIIEHMQWAATIFIRYPFLIRFAKPILTSKLARFGKYIVFLNHWEDVKFFQVPIWKAWQYFIASRKQFTEGMAKLQEDVYLTESTPQQESAGIKIVQKGGCPSNWNPVGIRDWHGQDPVDVYRPFAADDEMNIFSSIEADVAEKLNEMIGSLSDQDLNDTVDFSDIRFLDGDLKFIINLQDRSELDHDALKTTVLQMVKELPGIGSANCEVKLAK